MHVIKALRAVDRYEVVFEPLLRFVVGGTACKWASMPFNVAGHDVCDEAEFARGRLFFLHYSIYQLTIS